MIIRERDNQSYYARNLTSYLAVNSFCIRRRAAPWKIKSGIRKFCEVSLTWRCDQKVVPPSQDQNRAGRWCKARDCKGTDQRKRQRRERIKLCSNQSHRSSEFFRIPILLIYPPKILSRISAFWLCRPRLLKPQKSLAELRCVPSVNTLIEKCVLRQLTRNVTLARI